MTAKSRNKYEDCHILYDIVCNYSAVVSILNMTRLTARKLQIVNKPNLFILVINQLDAKNLFLNKFISCLYMFRAPCANRQESKLYYTVSGIFKPIGGRPVHRTATYRCDDTRGCIVQF